MIKTGVTEREARSIVRKHIDSTMNGLAAHVSGNAGKTGNPGGGDSKATADQHRVIQPLLNKLTDVTLTKCPEQMQHMQQVCQNLNRKAHLSRPVWPLGGGTRSAEYTKM